MTQVSTGGPYIAREVHEAALKVKDGIIRELVGRIEGIEVEVDRLEAETAQRYVCKDGEVVKSVTEDEPHTFPDGKILYPMWSDKQFICHNSTTVEWSAEKQAFFKPWIDLGVFGKVPLDPGKGWEFVPHGSRWEEGDEYWAIWNLSWAGSHNRNTVISSPGRDLGPYRRKIKPAPLVLEPSSSARMIWYTRGGVTFRVCPVTGEHIRWTTHYGLHRIGCSVCPDVGTSPTKSIKQVAEWWTKMCEPVAGESALRTLAPGDYIKTLEATPTAAAGADGPVAECSLCGGDGERPDPVCDQWYTCVRCEGTGKEPEPMYYSKPTNCHNPESEDTPPHNPVAPTVSPEIGKRYLCRNGEVTEEIAEWSSPTYPWRATVSGVTRTWMRCGRHDESKARSEYDLIAEYHEPSPPSESPDDWVTLTDPEHVIRKCDQISDYGTQWYGPSDITAALGKHYKNCGFKLVRCRRKDLPVVPVVPVTVERCKLPPVDSSKLPSIPREVLDDRSDWREQAAAWSELFKWCCRNGFDCADNRYNGLNGLGTLAQWILDLKSAAKPNHPNATPPVVPKTRTVTLREYRHTNDEFAWTSASTYLPMPTGRTCKSEVPE